MQMLADMVEPIRDHWLIALALLFASALAIWLVRRP